MYEYENVVFGSVLFLLCTMHNDTTIVVFRVDAAATAVAYVEMFG